MQCNELHALRIRANTIAQNCWPALGHRINRIMVALGHNHNHSGMQSCTCSVMDITHRRVTIPQTSMSECVHCYVQ